MTHSRGQYNKGCRCAQENVHCGHHCEECKSLAAAYVTQNRNAKRERVAQLGKLRSVPNNGEPPVIHSSENGGALRKAAEAQVAVIPCAQESHPLIVASIFFLADQCDSGGQPQQNAQAIKEMKLLLEQLQPKGAQLKSVGKTQQELIYEMFGKAL